MHHSVYGDPELDALEPWLLGGANDHARGAILFRGLSASRTTSLPLYTRIVLQNDVWGLLQRLAKSSTNTPGIEALRAEATNVFWALAPADTALAAIDGTQLPKEVAALHPASDGFLEYSSDHRILGHERAFGLRRYFRIVLSDRQRALVSQLVVVDRNGQVHMSNVVGEVEILQYSGPGTLAAATVLHLERAAFLRNSDALVVTDQIAQIPSKGASVPIIEFSPPVRVQDLPCARCHDDDNMMSLPFEGESPSARLTRFLEDAERLVPPKAL